MSLLFCVDLFQETVGVAPLVHHKQDITDVDTDAPRKLRVKEDVAGEAVPVTVEGQADKAILAVEDRRKS